MGVFSKIFSKTKLDYVLALDIGTEVVKALVVKIDSKENKGVVLGVGRVKQKLGNMQSGAVSDISGVIATSNKAIEIAKEKAGVKKIKKAIVGIAGELVKGTTTTVHYERHDHEVKIDLPELKNILQKVQTKAYERIKNQIAYETGHEGMDIKLINAAIANVSIDGYQVTNPLGFQGGDVSISVFNAYAPMMHLGALETAADKLKINLISVAAEPYAVARSVDFEGEFDFNAIFIDIGGGTTDIAVVRNGGLEGTRMFALGGRSFTKRLTQEFGITFEEAEELKLHYAEGKLEDKYNKKIDGILEDDCNVWLSGVELSLVEFSQNNNSVLPPKILLCGGGSGLPGLRKVLSSSSWTKNLSFGKSPEISFLQPKDVANIIDKTEELVSPQDVTPMGLANLVLDLVNEEKVMAGILKRTISDIQK